MVTEDPPGFSIHESATVATVWPMSPCYNNLVYFDAFKSQETVDTVVPERHDGQPFTSRLLAQAGCGPAGNKPLLRLEMVTRTLPVYVDLASYVVDQLKKVGIEVTV